MGFHGPIRSFTLPVSWPRAGLTRNALVGRAWFIFLVGGLGIAAGAALIGDEHTIQPALSVSGLATVLAIVAGIRINRPARPTAWLLLAGCTLLTTVGNVAEKVGGDAAFAGQLMSAVGSFAGFLGFMLLVRGRIPGGDRPALLDAAILASGMGVLVWAFGFAPYLVAARQSSVISAAFLYPALIALAMVARMWFLTGAHRPATRLIVLLVLASNLILVLDLVRGVTGDGRLTGPMLFADFAEIVFMGAAALHPSMALSPERQRPDLRRMSRGRIVALTAALLVNPATLAIEVSGGQTIDPAPYLIGGVLIGVLVIGRLSDALRQLGESLRERESLMALLQHQALYDPLTSLPNRNLFNERLAADFASQGPGRVLAVLLVDLDDFKAINDSYGHETGDALLAAVGQRLRAAVREGDTAARLGGDEFVIALPNCPDSLVPVSVGRRILASLSKPYDIGGHHLTVRATVGVAIAGREDRTADDLVRNADVAMYLAKGRGKGRLEVFEASMQVSAMTQIQLRADLAVAIAAGDLRLHYQRVVELETGRTIGYEALVRWLRDGQLVPPGDFIPLAESSGLIGPLTDWVVNEACRTVAPWGRLGDRPWVSVNLSSSQLLRQDIVSRLERTLAETGLPADRLILEITESSLLEIDLARPAIERLSQAGIRLAIDDFGTGYSALSYLARLPIDIVKIDRSFVMALEHAGPEEAIASAIIALAKRLGLTTVGEGIETAGQLAQLSALGCNLGQGYLLGRPVAAEHVTRAEEPRPVRRRLSSVASLTADLVQIRS